MKIANFGRNLYTAVKNGPKDKRTAALAVAGCITGCVAGGAILGSSLVPKKDKEVQKSSMNLTKVLAAAAGAVAGLFVCKKVASVVSEKVLKMLSDRAKEALEAARQAAKTQA